jgi:hypothetical protein
METITSVQHTKLQWLQERCKFIKIRDPKIGEKLLAAYTDYMCRFEHYDRRNPTDIQTFNPVIPNDNLDVIHVLDNPIEWVIRFKDSNGVWQYNVYTSEGIIYKNKPVDYWLQLTPITDTIAVDRPSVQIQWLQDRTNHIVVPTAICTNFEYEEIKQQLLWVYTEYLYRFEHYSATFGVNSNRVKHGEHLIVKAIAQTAWQINFKDFNGVWHTHQFSKDGVAVILVQHPMINPDVNNINQFLHDAPTGQGFHRNPISAAKETAVIKHNAANGPKRPTMPLTFNQAREIAEQVSTRTSLTDVQLQESWLQDHNAVVKQVMSKLECRNSTIADPKLIKLYNAIVRSNSDKDDHLPAYWVELRNRGIHGIFKLFGRMEAAFNSGRICYLSTTVANEVIFAKLVLVRASDYSTSSNKHVMVHTDVERFLKEAKFYE